ncbi:MAG: dTDP-4-dehydrorhamnose reductase [Candidatus Neomarinimicrobiota bacterium]|nr:dTDP-4-dehydrorhamnose reductase [Candidatus Neomarinimicrobiota bacterium]
MTTILITGASGQLGMSLKRIFNSKYEIISTTGNNNPTGSSMHLDVTNPMLFKEVMETTNPDLVINLAALTNVDLCEKNPELAYSINIGGMDNLVNAFKGPIIHVSTDYVFDGEDGPYKEEDTTNPLNVYGLSKLESEKLLLDHSENSLVIRSNVIYDYSSKSEASFLNWVVDSLTQEKEINVVEDQWNNPTWTGSLAVVIDRAIDTQLTGLVHWGDGDLVSRFDFANKIADVFNLKKSLIKPILTSELNQTAKRPLKSGLKSDYAQNILNLEPPTIKECLETIVEQK